MLYYRVTARDVQVATEPQALLQDAAQAIRTNEGMVAEHLVGLVTSRTETLVDGVLRLPAAHMLEVGDGGARLHRYWEIDPGREIRYRTDREYQEQLRGIFVESVRCRLRASAPVGILLSGGLDSSSVAGAALAMRDAGGDLPGVETFSMTFPGRACDEGEYIAAVNDRWRTTAHVLAGGTSDWRMAADEARRYRDVPTTPGSLAADPLRRLARRRGARVLLSGLGGDEWLMGSPYYYADLLRRLRLPRLARSIARDARSPEFVGYRSAVRLSVWPLLPQPIRQLTKRAAGHDVVPAWIDPGFAARTALRDRLRQYASDLRFPTFARRESYQEATSGLATLALEQIDRTLGWVGLEERHPFHDRRLIEFAFALPADQLWREGRPKSLMRRAFARWLPDAVRDRLWHPDYSHLVHEAIRDVVKTGLMNDPVVARRGWVSGSQLRQAYGRADDPAAPFPQLRPLWAACAVELWADARAGERPGGVAAGRSRVEEAAHEQPARV